jgi:integrase/recombinase XerD
MIALEPNQSNHCLIRLLYIAGLCVSEACSLQWGACTPRKHGGQLTTVGKGQKERTIVIKPDMWNELMALKAVTQGPDVFISRGNGRGSSKHVSPRQAQAIVRRAAIRAGIDKPVSPHYLRYTHASIALDRDCPITLVRDTLGHDNVSTTNKYLHTKPDHSSSEYL